MKDELKKTLKKYPRLSANLIAESLGYFTPLGAAKAILLYQDNRAYYNEWYSHQLMLHMTEDTDEKELLLKINRDTIKRAFYNRLHHRGYMSDYKLAKDLVNKAVETDSHPVLASWF